MPDNWMTALLLKRKVRAPQDNGAG